MPGARTGAYNATPGATKGFPLCRKIRRVERQNPPLRTSLNALPVLAAYREQPGDFYSFADRLRRVLGTLTNIDQEDSRPRLHSFPDTLKPDPISGDFAQNFFRPRSQHRRLSGQHPEFGWAAFGGNVETGGPVVRLTPRDSFRSRAYLPRSASADS
jgi:hypothetical protein